MMCDNFSCSCADYLESGEEGADDWVGSRILVEFVGKGFLRVFMKLMMKMASNGNGRKVVKRITGEIIENFFHFFLAIECNAMYDYSD
nr:hypothetical protein Itr_chr15CG12920 [Ipomoea trifida]